MTGRYTKTCAYCAAEFKTDTLHQRYCCPTHKTYDYRRRRQERSAETICYKCGKLWIAPRSSAKGVLPHYCAACQEYFGNLYKQKKLTFTTCSNINR